jgi:hypothetical protein
VAVTNEALHSSLIEGLRNWNEQFPPSAQEEGGWADVDEADEPGEGAFMRVDPAPPPASFDMVFTAATSGAEPASAAPPAPASAAPPAPASAAPAPPANADAGAAREAAAAE